MTKFTPQELLTVAQRVMPAPSHQWKIITTHDGKLHPYCGFHGVFDPEENGYQYRALVERVYLEINTQAMIAAVLALEESEDG